MRRHVAAPFRPTSAANLLRIWACSVPDAAQDGCRPGNPPAPRACRDCRGDRAPDVPETTIDSGSPPPATNVPGLLTKNLPRQPDAPARHYEQSQ